MLTPCCGVETPLIALRQMGVPVECHCWETEPCLRDQILHEHVHHGIGGQLNIGRKAGDWTSVYLSELPDADIVCSGPPCPPFSRSGKSLGWADARTRPFLMVLECIIEQARRPSSRLKVFTIENVPGMRDRKPGRDKSALQEVLAYLRAKMDGWQFWAWVLQANQHGLAQRRRRLFINGRRSAIFYKPMPSTSPEDIVIEAPFLGDVLLKDQPSELHRLTAKQELVRQHCEAMLQEKHREVGGYVLACVDLSRAPGKVRPTMMRMDGTCFTLTCSSCYIWLMSAGEGPRYDRFMQCWERAMLQGLDPMVCARIGGLDCKRVKAMGNAMPLPCVGLVLACLLSEPLESIQQPVA